VSARAYIRIKDTNGTIKAVLTANGADGGENGFFWLSWKKRVNGIGVAQFEIDQANPDASYATSDKYQLEVVRSYPEIGLAEYTAFDGLLRDYTAYTDEKGRNRLTVTAFDYNSLPDYRRIGYYANKANYTIFTAVKAETVLKRLVRDNCDPAFATTANTRDRTPNTIGLTIATDLARGNTINWTCGGRSKLIDELAKIALIAGGDWRVNKTGLTTYQFEFYPGQLGTDRTTGANAIVFSLDRRNMIKPKLVYSRSNEKTVALVGGKGEEIDRIIRVRTGVNYGATNDIETFVDGRDTDDVNVLDSLGDHALATAQVRALLEFEVLQTGINAIEKDYFLGDLVKAQYYGLTFTQQIYELTFEYKGPREAVDVVMRTL
jgi:hypothetical protein